jgi:hypothetical protein
MWLVLILQGTVDGWLARLGRVCRAGRREDETIDSDNTAYMY